jgi:hypothetical protein
MGSCGQQATIKVSLVTLAPNSTHTTAIYNGHCGARQQVRALQLSADDAPAHLRPVHRQCQRGADERLALAVNNATGTDVYSKIVIACADIPVDLTTGTEKRTIAGQPIRRCRPIASTRPAKRN